MIPLYVAKYRVDKLYTKEFCSLAALHEWVHFHNMRWGYLNSLGAYQAEHADGTQLSMAELEYLSKPGRRDSLVDEDVMREVRIFRLMGQERLEKGSMVQSAQNEPTTAHPPGPDQATPSHR